MPKHASVQVDGNVEKDGDEEESDNEIEEDADDEDDGEDDADDVCKCQKCRQLFKSCRTPSDTNFQFEVSLLCVFITYLGYVTFDSVCFY